MSVLLLPWVAVQGAFIASKLNALHKQRVDSLCLIDPVCLAM
jgi:hypothetical protein